MAVEPKIKDQKKFKSYNEIEQGMFKALRKGMLTIMPTIDEAGNYEDLAIEQCETFASTVVDEWPEELKQQQIQYSFVNGLLVQSRNGQPIVNNTAQTNTVTG